MKRHALFVGVDKYDDSSIQNLEFPSKDAMEMASVFRRMLKFDRAEELINPKHSPEVVDAVKDMTRGLGPGDLFLFFFAGHGFRVKENHVLVCAKDEYADLEDEYAGLSVGQLKKRMYGPWNRMLVLDACQNDIRASRGSDCGMTSRDLELIHTSDVGTSDVGTPEAGLQIVVTSCSEGQKALEVSDLKHGLFTSAFLDSVTSFANDRRRIDLEALRTDLGVRMCGLISRYRLSGKQDPMFTMPTDAGGIVLLDGVVPMVFASQQPLQYHQTISASTLITCPICGKRNVITNTFKCAKCGKDHLCTEHLSAEYNCCDVCAHKESATIKDKAQEYFDKGERFFHGGAGSGKDYVRAVKYYRIAAEKGHEKAQFRLAQCYALGKGVKKDPRTAMKLCLSLQCSQDDEIKNGLAELNADDEVQYELGLAYERGDGIDKNIKRAAYWFNLSAMQGNINSQSKIGAMYCKGRGVEVNAKEAKKWLLKAAKKGNVYAQEMLGYYYSGDFFGSCDDWDDEKDDEAEKWRRRAIKQYLSPAKSGDKKAQEKLVELYELIGDAEECLKWSRMLLNSKGEDNVTPRVLLNIGEYSEDEEEKVKWYRLASEKGDALAQYRLGHAYWYGEYGLHKDRKEAVRFLRLAAEQDHHWRQYLLDWIICQDDFDGLYLMPDMFNWCLDAANSPTSKDIKPKLAVGIMHMKGIGIAKDADKAKVWFEAALKCHGYKLGLLSTKYWLAKLYLTEFNKSMGCFTTALSLCKDVIREGGTWAVNAALLLASAYYCDIGGARNITEAVKWFKASVDLLGKVSENEDFEWLSLLGFSNLSKRKDVDILLSAANGGDADSQWRLSWIYAIGNGTDVNYPMSIKMCRKAAESGNLMGQYLLGWHYAIGRTGKQDVAEALKWLSLAEHQGFKEAAAAANFWRNSVNSNMSDDISKSDIAKEQFILGKDAFSREEYEVSFSHYLLSAEMGCAEASYELWEMYRDGIGVTSGINNLIYASMWLHRSGLQGCVAAQRQLVSLYRTGEGLLCRDTVKATYWKVRLANNGDLVAQLELAKEYSDTDKSISLKWYDAAAEQGAIEAKGAILGFCESIDTKNSDPFSSPAKAWCNEAMQIGLKWIRRAAEDGDARMQWKMGELYEVGFCVDKDVEGGFRWYDKAAETEPQFANKIVEHGWLPHCGRLRIDEPYVKEIVIKWTEKEATSGSSRAMEYLALYYRPLDVKMSFKWCSRAIYSYSGSEKRNTAMDWFMDWTELKSSAEKFEFDKSAKMIALKCERLAKTGNGFGYAQLRLSKCFEKGIGVRRNLKMAIFWCGKAAEKGIPEAMQRLSALKSDYASKSFLGKLFG